jgi:hypothetical protein
MGKQHIDTQNCKLPKYTKVAVIKEKFTINPTLDFNIDSKKPVGNKIVRFWFKVIILKVEFIVIKIIDPLQVGKFSLNESVASVSYTEGEEEQE